MSAFNQFMDKESQRLEAAVRMAQFLLRQPAEAAALAFESDIADELELDSIDREEATELARNIRLQASID